MTATPETGPGVKRYRKKPIPLEARQVTPETAEDVAAWCGGEFVPATGAVEAYVVVPSLDGEGSRKALVGDWVLKGTRGEFWRVEESIFAETYEPADAADPVAAERERIAELAGELDATYSPHTGADSGIAFSFADFIRGQRP